MFGKFSDAIDVFAKRFWKLDNSVIAKGEKTRLQQWKTNVGRRLLSLPFSGCHFVTIQLLQIRKLHEGRQGVEVTFNSFIKERVLRFHQIFIEELLVFAFAVRVFCSTITTLILMSFASRYCSWSEEKQNLFILVMIGLAGCLVFFFSAFIDNIGLLLGWILGTVIEILCYVTIVAGSRFLLSGGKEGGSTMGLLGAGMGMFRLLFYAGGLVLGGFATYVWGTPSHGYCNLFTVFAGYMPLMIVLLVGTAVRLKKDKTPKQEETHE